MSTVNVKTYEAKIGRKFSFAAKVAVRAGIKIGDKAFRKNISLTCHSLKDLAEMGHPYSTKHGYPIHEPYWLIHKQRSGGLKKTSVMNPVIYETTDSFVGNFGFDPDDDLPIWLVGGTSTMIPRPVVSGTLGQVKSDIKTTIIETFKRWEPKAGISFT